MSHHILGWPGILTQLLSMERTASIARTRYDFASGAALCGHKHSIMEWPQLVSGRLNVVLVVPQAPLSDPMYRLPHPRSFEVGTPEVMHA